MAWLSRVNFISSDTLSFTDINNLGNDIRAWGDNVNGGGYTLSNVALSASSGTMGLVIGGTGTTSTLRLRSTSGVGTTGADIIFQAGNNGATEVMRLQNGGNVGIGTASPGGKLTIVSGDSATASNQVIISGGRSVSTGAGAILFTNSFWNSGFGAANIVGLDSGGSGGHLSFGTLVDGGGASGTPTEKMRILQNGNVGIGTTNPGVKLDVAGTAAVDYLRLDPVDGTNEGGEIQFVGAGSNGSFSIDNYAGNCRIFTLASGKILDVVGGSLSLSGQSTGSQYITIGSGRSSNGFSYIDLVGDTTYSSFGTRLIRGTGGANTATSLQHRGTGEFQLYAYEAAPLVVYLNSAEKMRIDSSGNVLIGYTTSNGLYLLQVNSQIFATNATIATSDGRYKENISSIKSGLDVVSKLNPVSFTWKQHEIHNFDSGTQVGFIAQDVQEALTDEPYLESIVKRNEVELKDGTKEEFYGLSDAKLIPILVKAIQELKAEIDILKARN